MGNPSKGNPYGALIEITNLGNGQYKIKSETNIYDNGQWISINETVSIPTATENVLTGSISTTNYNIAGYATLESSGSLNATKLATYKISENYPVTYTINNNQITFQFGSPLVNNISLQSINVPTITKQQLQTLESGQNTNIKPGWYYYPLLGEFIQISYQTIQQPQINWNQLWYGYGSTYQNNSLSTNTQNVTTQQTQILQYSFFSPQILSDIWKDIITIRKNAYNWSNSISNLPIISNIYNIGKDIFYDIYNIGENTTNWVKNKIFSINWGQELNLLNQLQAFGVLYSTGSPLAYILGADLYLKATGAKGKYVSQLNKLSNDIVKATDIAELLVGTMDIGNVIGVGIGATRIGAEAAMDSSELLASESRLYTTAVNMGRLSSSFDTITTGTTQMFKAINPEFIESGEEILTNVKNIGTSENFAVTLIRNAINGIKENPIGYLKEVGIWTGINWASTNIEDWLFGKPVTSLKGQLEILGESAVESATFVTLGRIFESMANPILRSWIKPNEPLSWAIRKRVLYDVGANFIAGVGSSYVGQGVGVLMGLQKGISNTEALLSGGIAAGGTLLFEGIMGLRALKTGNFFNFATDTVPRNVKISDVSLNIIGEDMGTSLYRATGLADYYPRIGGRIITENDIQNLKLMERAFETRGIIRMDNNIDVVNIGNLNIPTYRYAGYLVSTSGENEVYGITEGLFFGFRRPIQSEDPFLYYLEKIQKVRDYLIGKYPEFEKISNTPETGLYLFKTLTSGTYEQTIKGVNEGKTLLESGMEAYFNKLEKNIYDQTILNTQNEIKELQFSENEAKQAMEIASQYYNDALETLNKYKTDIQNILKNDIKNLAKNSEYLTLTNLNELGNYIPPERFNIKPEKLPNPEGINKEILYIEKPLSKFEINNVDFSKNIAGEFEFRAFGKSILSTGDIYTSTYYGHGLEYMGEDNSLSHIGTVYGIEKDLNGKGWYTIKQYGGKKLAEDMYLVYGYGESWDPNVRSMSLPSLESVNGQPLSKEEAQLLLKETIRPPAPPGNNVRPLFSMYAAASIGTNVGNVYNTYINQPSYNYYNNNQPSNIKGKVKPMMNEIININNIKISRQPSIKTLQPTGLSNPTNQLNINTNILKITYLPLLDLFNIRINETQKVTIPTTTTTLKQIFSPPPTPTPPSNPPITEFAPSIILGLQPNKVVIPALNRNVKATYDIFYVLNRLR